MAGLGATARAEVRFEHARTEKRSAIPVLLPMKAPDLFGFFHW
jgi:hypothetical protein